MLDCWNEKMQQITLQTQSKWILCQHDVSLHNSSYSTNICAQERHQQGAKIGGQLSTALSWSQSSKDLFKGNWSPVRPNMGNGNAQAVISLCIPTAPVLQD